MYNTEKYIGACLISLLNQTFQNFEVIVVDDGSTDNSCAVVESFIPKFDGRLKLVKSEINGGPGAPSNRGVTFSRGKYVYVMDSDDLITVNALEVLYKNAEDFNADVVSMDVGFDFSRNSDKPFPSKKDVNLKGWHQGPFVDKPTLESDKISERVWKICNVKVGWIAWQKFVRRDFLIEEKIIFPELRMFHDINWMVEVFSLAKRIVTIPQPLYIYRSNPTSNTKSKKTLEQELIFFLGSSIEALKFMGEFLGSKKIFKENPQYLWEILKFLEGAQFNFVREKFSRTNPSQSYLVFNKKFSETFGNNGNLIAYLCTSSSFLRSNLVHMSQRIAQLENQVRELQKPK